MKYRKLRIAWSVAWGIGCVLCIAMWVRSYSYWNMTGGKLGPWHTIGINSIRGHLFLGIFKDVHSPWSWHTYPATSLTETEATAEIFSSTGSLTIVRWPIHWEIDVLGIGVVNTTPWRYVAMPYWLLVASTAAIAASPWLPWRFSLRTLLIGMTVAAIGLGWLLYAFRK